MKKNNLKNYIKKELRRLMENHLNEEEKLAPWIKPCCLQLKHKECCDILKDHEDGKKIPNSTLTKAKTRYEKAKKKEKKKVNEAQLCGDKKGKTCGNCGPGYTWQDSYVTNSCICNHHKGAVCHDTHSIGPGGGGGLTKGFDDASDTMGSGGIKGMGEPMMGDMMRRRKPPMFPKPMPTNPFDFDE